MSRAVKAWRYIEPVYAAEALAIGRFKIGTAAGFWDMEGPQQDPLDSSIERRWQAYIGDTNNDPESVRIAASMGIHLHNCKDLTFTDCRHVVRSRPAYVLCLCDCPDNEYLLAGWKTAVIEIADVEAFALRLQRADNRLGFATAGPVDYGCVSFDARQPAARPDPFLKGEAFSPEREIRIVWEAADEAIEPIFPVAPAVLDLLSRVR